MERLLHLSAMMTSERASDRFGVEWRQAAILTGSAALGLVVLHLWPGFDWSVCVFHAITSVACPGCGMTRALVHLARGEWVAMWLMHPMAPVLMLQSGLAALAWIFLRDRGQRLLRIIGLRLVMLNAMAILALWVWRLAAGTLPL